MEHLKQLLAELHNQILGLMTSLNLPQKEQRVLELQEAGIDASSAGTEIGKFNITATNLEKHLAALTGVLKRAETASK